MISHIKVSRLVLWVGLTLLIGLALSLGSALWRERLNQSEVQNSLNVSAEKIGREIVSAIELYQYGLRGARGAALTAGFDQLNRETFRRYSLSRDIASEFPGALGFGIIRRVTQSKESSFVEQARRDGWPEFAVRQLSPHDGERYIIQYIEPVERNRAAVGLDVASESMRREAADRAMRTGNVSITGPITLVQGANEVSQSFLIMMPIYWSAATPPTEDERLSSAVGWSYAPLTMKDVFAHVSIDLSALTLTVSDVTDPSSPISFFQLHNDDTAHGAIAASAIDNQVFGRTWRIAVDAHPAFAKRLNQPSPLVIFIFGALTSILAATVVALLNIGRQRKRLSIATQARLATIIDNSGDPIIGEALDGRITSWNAAAERLFGYSESEVLDCALADLLIPAEMRHEDADVLERLARREVVHPFETVRVSKDKTRIDVLVSPVAIHDELGRVVGVAKILRDLRGQRAEQQRQAEFAQTLEQQVSERTTELKSVNTLLQDVLDAASAVSIITTAVDGTIRIFNKGAQRMLGYRAEELVGKHSPAIIHVREEVEERGQQLTKQFGEPISGFSVFVHIPEREGSETREWTYVRKDGSKLDVSLVVTAVRNEFRVITGYLGIAIDITKQKQSMDALADAKLAADAANRAKSQFLAMMSHELRTPMAGVLGMADLLINSEVNDEQQRLLVAQIRSANALLDLLNDILDFAKIEAERVEIESFDFDLRGIAEDIGATVAPLASERGNTVQIDISPNIEKAFCGDGKRYRQVLMNLVGNANKFTAEGRIRVQITQKQIALDRFEISTLVNDTGIGISPEAVSQLFQPFVQEDISTSRKFGGTGLGLAISKQLVELMGGRIWVESERGVGSTFGFTVVLDRGSAENCEKSAMAPRLASLAGFTLPVANRPLKILLAEDNDTNRMLVVTLLSRMTHDITAVENGALAVEEIRDGDYDLVLMDMQMPVMDGPTAVRLIREMSGDISKIPIIALTADALSDSEKRYLAHGVNAVVTKPVDWRQLNMEMERLTDIQEEQQNGKGHGSNSSVTSREQFPVLDEDFLGVLAEAAGLNVFAPLLSSFINSIATYGDDLQRTQTDIGAAKKTAHALKGITAQFGAKQLSELAREIEVEAQNTDDVVSVLPRLKSLIDLTTQQVKAWGKKQVH